MTASRPDHRGIDLRAEVGTPVAAPELCVVERTGWDDSGGRIVVLRSATHRYTFCHLEDFQCYPWNFVARGEVFGHTGKSGKVTGPHLHLQIAPINERGERLGLVDPWPLLADAELWEVGAEGEIDPIDGRRVTR
jgi:murein DD-endopeptidase MepM/ murein hydrolase activator NlpD